MKHEDFVAWLGRVYRMTRRRGHTHSVSIGENRNIESILPKDVTVDSGRLVWSAKGGSGITYFREPRNYGADAICTIFDYDNELQITVYPKKVSSRKVVGQPQPQTVPKGAFL